MAWALWISSVAQTSKIARDEPVELEFPLNERATAHFTCLTSLVPDRFAEVQIYDQDGTTLLFGGVVYQRRTLERPNRHDHYRLAVDATDYGLYADWCYQTATYASSVTLNSVLGDLVNSKLSPYGVTLSSSQVTGPTLAPFTWTTLRVSDALRELSDRTGMPWRVNPDKTLLMSSPGTVAAPYSLVDNTPYFLEAHWEDPDTLPVTRVVLSCGPAGTPWITQTWISSANASWTTDIPAAGGTAGYVTVNSIFLTVGDGASYEWDQASSTLSLGTANTPAAGQVLALSYVAQFPFQVVATAAGSPTVEALYSAPEIVNYAQGLEAAAGILAQQSGAALKLEGVSKYRGWQPGQIMPSSLVARTISGNYLVTNVRMSLESDARWISRISGEEQLAYSGNYLDRWREMKGGGSSSGVVVLPSEGGVGALPVYYLGGSRFHAVQVTA